MRTVSLRITEDNFPRRSLIKSQNGKGKKICPEQELVVLGFPKKSDYSVVESKLPALNSGEILVKSEYISVDPYLRFYNNLKLYQQPYDQFGLQVGVVQESKDPKYEVGDRVVSHKGWTDYYIENPSAPQNHPSEIIYKLPDLKGLPASHGCGAIGMPGATAYFGLLELCQPKAGETVVVSGAAGAVGSLVGQIAKLKGCRVIGFAGSDKKVAWLEKELGFDKAFNYQKVDIKKALKEAAPNGVDCYFDNVGGEMSSSVISQMNPYGRVAVCGSISSYNDEQTAKASILQPDLVINDIRVEGFRVWRWYDRWMEALTQLTNWVASGQIVAREHVTVGFQNIFDAFVGMLSGENSGKAVVRLMK